MFEVNLDGKELKEIISQETFLPDQHITSSRDKTQGIEDARLFTFQNKTYYNASVLNHSSNIIATSINEYQFYQPYKINILKPSFLAICFCFSSICSSTNSTIFPHFTQTI